MNLNDPSPAGTLTQYRRGIRALLRLLTVAVFVISLTGVGVLSYQMWRHWPRPASVVTPTEGSVRFTTILSVSALVLMMANVAAFERGVHRVTSTLGMTCAATGLLLGLSEAWSWWRWDWAVGEGARKTMAMPWIWAAVFALISLLSFCRIPKRWRWLRSATGVCLIAAGLLLSDIATLVGLPHSSTISPTLVDIAAILSACGCATMLLIHQGFYFQRLDAFRAGPLEVQLACPRCGLQHAAPVGRTHCPGCRLMLSIELADAHCDTCGYPLYKLPGNRCPECGQPFTGTGAQKTQKAAET